eukprot:SAG31_NODE_7044_length_1806_cov_1.272994_2_plen_285_part_00
MLSRHDGFARTISTKATATLAKNLHEITVQISSVPAWSLSSLTGWAPMLRMGAAGTATVMGEWWSWEICAGMAGILGEVSLASHVSIQNFSFFYFPLPFSVSMGATIRVGNLLGAGDWRTALVTTKLALTITNIIMISCSVVVFFARNDFARIYTEDDRVIDTVSEVTTVYVFFIFLGGSTQCLRGVLAGCGRQVVNARVSLAASYAVGLPISYLFCFYLEWGLRGLWLGLVCSNIFRTIVLMWITFHQDWESCAKIAMAKATEKTATEAAEKPLATPTDEVDE